MFGFPVGAHSNLASTSRIGDSGRALLPTACAQAAQACGAAVRRAVVCGTPPWACRLYDAPGLPTTDLTATVTLRALRRATTVLPDPPAVHADVMEQAATWLTKH
ncbi:MAG: hypothetical protein M3460_29150 [Actinomycetota bacterium]|nr:hypothetical protein [Actinomycetota bacterium]